MAAGSFVSNTAFNPYIHRQRLRVGDHLFKPGTWLVVAYLIVAGLDGPWDELPGALSGLVASGGDVLIGGRDRRSGRLPRMGSPRR